MSKFEWRHFWMAPLPEPEFWSFFDDFLFEFSSEKSSKICSFPIDSRLELSFEMTVLAVLILNFCKLMIFSSTVFRVIRRYTFTTCENFCFTFFVSAFRFPKPMKLCVLHYCIHTIPAVNHIKIFDLNYFKIQSLVESIFDVFF